TRLPGYLILYGKVVGSVRIHLESLAPHLRAGPCVGQAYVDAGQLAVPPQIALDEVIDVAYAAGVRDVLKSILKEFCHASRQNTQFAEATESGDDLLCQAIGEVVESGAVGIRLKRPDRHCWPSRSIPRHLGGLLRQTDHVTAAGNGTNELATSAA